MRYLRVCQVLASYNGGSSWNMECLYDILNTEGEIEKQDWILWTGIFMGCMLGIKTPHYSFIVVGTWNVQNIGCFGAVCLICFLWVVSPSLSKCKKVKYQYISRELQVWGFRLLLAVTLKPVFTNLWTLTPFILQWNTFLTFTRWI